MSGKRENKEEERREKSMLTKAKICTGNVKDIITFLSIPLYFKPEMKLFTDLMQGKICKMYVPYYLSFEKYFLLARRRRDLN